MPPPATAEEPEGPVQAPRSPGEMFITFTLLSMQSFGGALSFMERTVVRDKRWLTPKEFLGLYAISQVLPGPTGMSFCVLLGDRFFGTRGAVATLGGFLLVPAAIVIAVASVFQRFQHVPQVQGALHGMGTVAVGLILSTAMRMSRSLRGERVGIAVAVLSFAAVGLARLPVSTVVLTLGVASVAWAWRSRGR
jgi:chromate transporter